VWSFSSMQARTPSRRRIVYDASRPGLRAAGVRSAGPASRSADDDLRGLIVTLTDQVKSLAVLPGQVEALSEELQRMKGKARPGVEAAPAAGLAAAVAGVAALPGGQRGSEPLSGPPEAPGLASLIGDALAGASPTSLDLGLHGLGGKAEEGSGERTHTVRADLFRQKQLAPSLLQHIRTSGFRNCVEYAAGHTLKGRAKHEARRLAQIVDSMVRAGVPATTEYMEIALRSLCGVGARRGQGESEVPGAPGVFST
jgi:hypothetical protein